MADITKKKTRAWRKFSAVRAGMWLTVIPLAYYFGWIYSVAFVAVCSLYANVSGDFSAWRADTNREEEMLELLKEIKAKLDGES